MANKYQDGRAILKQNDVHPANWMTQTVFKHLDALGYDWDGLRWIKRHEDADANWQPAIGEHVRVRAGAIFTGDLLHEHKEALRDSRAVGEITARGRGGGKTVWWVVFLRGAGWFDGDQLERAS